jgi:prepilin-type processing-associated H-X9-DG protein
MEQGSIYSALGVDTYNTQAKAAMDAVKDPNVRAVMGTPVASFLCPADVIPSPTADRKTKMDNGTATLVDASNNKYNNVIALQNYVGNMGRGRDALPSPRWYQMPVGLWAEGPFNVNSKTTFARIGDGLSNTILLGERAWTYTAAGTTQQSSAAAMYVTVSTKGPTDGDGASHALGMGGDGINYPYGNSTSSAGIFTSRHVGGANFALGDGSVRFISEHIDYNTATSAYDSVFECLLAMNDGQAVNGEY